MKLKLQQRKDWDELQTNPFQQLKALREITHRYEDTRYYISTVAMSIQGVFNTRQKDGESIVKYGKHFDTDVKIMEQQFGKLSMVHALSKDPKYIAADKQQRDKMEEQSYYRILAYQFLMGCVSEKAALLRIDCQKNYVKQKDSYPTDAIDRVVKYRNRNSITNCLEQSQTRYQQRDDATREGFHLPKTIRLYQEEMELYTNRLNAIDVIIKVIMQTNVLKPLQMCKWQTKMEIMRQPQTRKMQLQQHNRVYQM